MKRIFFLILVSCCNTFCYAQSGIITTILGNGGTVDTGVGGVATAASIGGASLCEVGPDGNLYVALSDENFVRKVTPDGRYLPFAGNGSSIAGGGDGGPASAASISRPSRIAFDSHGDFYVSETRGNRIRKIDMHTGVISTYAGGRYSGWIDTGFGDLATNASFVPIGITFDKDDNLFITTSPGHILRVDRTTQILTKYAGNGRRVYGGDGGAATAAGVGSVGIQIDSSGMVYFDNLTYIRTIDPATHIVTCIAGNDTIGRTYSGDGCAPTATAMNPHDIQFDKHGNLVMGDLGNLRRVLCIRKSDNRVYTLAGTGVAGFSGDGGPATAAKIQDAQAVTVDSCDNVYFSDVPNYRVRKISVSQTGPQGITILPSSAVEKLCYGMPITFTATLGNPSYCGIYQWTVNGVTVGSNSTQFRYSPINGDTVRCSISRRWVCDTTTGAISNILIMLVDSLAAPTISLTGGVVTARVGDTVHVTATISGAAGVYEIHWRNRGTWFATTTTPALSYIKAAGNDTLTATLVSLARTCYDSVSSGTQNILGITPVPAIGQLQLTCHPNPATHTVTLSWGSQLPPRITIYNATGIQVYESIPTGDEQNINLRNWSAGVYYIKCEGYHVFRLVKM